MKRIVVTGGSGKAGRATVQELIEHGYEVTNADWKEPATPLCPFVQTDLTDLGQTIDVLKGADAVVHLAAIPAPGLLPDSETYRINSQSTYNVFNAAVTLGLQRVVWASSETCLGLPFVKESPIYAPLDEAQPAFPESVYSLTKILGEESARQFHRWSGIPFIALRFTNIMEPQDYAAFESWQNDPTVRRWNLWGYVDARDVGQSCRRGLECSFNGADHFIIAAADTCMRMDNAKLLKAEFPDVELKPGTTANESLLSIAKAQEVLGYQPQYSWRDLL
ncbi:NAD-dependent epimerase/dehydratase family protein [Coraliomargarita akajimensis]|uniref:NAD-dependent epimerase/dehydratase n=1 Tax=Coraliomargarita akajimensis (strain DSM 45221 / IAM 15411 / JCM 23193 / KCTC 12865 / 04OKA010-24) TaxID=583355 RepID=D5EJ25_CORAD|nr:NAD(P)-dependent oxidoreductase [Coraliomargarita akajimensis]ADE54424.1 NAD-dependent epimerase/dehydratase [Coraliomargarita akajimensis DSM 45221]